ncbi:hypothetical protein PROFUN_04973 [Planoprotostelium fungivorum]|uniref:Uncharacterized protein n=1 Tax=Planoprotostelium fungivorum TaxID=1890364 RepID=A0A2P6NSQ6_9EUKA|nr:hypothetical protein PROFUN_04973 [Planoprotostelium fungivorum]
MCAWYKVDFCFVGWLMCGDRFTTTPTHLMRNTRELLNRIISRKERIDSNTTNDADLVTVLPLDLFSCLLSTYFATSDLLPLYFTSRGYRDIIHAILVRRSREYKGIPFPIPHYPPWKEDGRPPQPFYCEEPHPVPLHNINQVEWWVNHIRHPHKTDLRRAEQETTDWRVMSLIEGLDHHHLKRIIRNGDRKERKDWLLCIVKSGDLPLLKKLWKSFARKSHPSTESTRANLWRAAAARGLTHVLKWLKREGHFYWESLYVIAAREGRVNVLDWLRESGDEPQDLGLVLREALWFGRIRVIEWLEGHYNSTQGQVFSSREILDDSTRGDDLEVLEWSIRKIGLTENIMKSVIRYGNVTTANFALSQKNVQLCPHHYDDFEGQDADLLRLLSSHLPPPHPSQLVLRCVSSQSVECLRWLREQKVKFQETDFEFFGTHGNAACMVSMIAERWGVEEPVAMKWIERTDGDYEAVYDEGEPQH